MQTFILSLLLAFTPYFSSKNIEKTELINDSHELYAEMKLDGVVNYSAFEQAFVGYCNADTKRKDIMTVIDFSKPSTDERLYVIDMKRKKLLYSSHVSHGRRSGENYATSFSNTKGSNQSSLGFYVTENTYQGRNGYSLILNGLEKGINDRAKERAIVIHGADYANPSVIKSSGRLGRSQGCPALPRDVSSDIIDIIKEGTLLYIYANNDDYLLQSSLLEDYTTGVKI